MTTGSIGSPAMNIVEVVSKAYGALHLGGDAGGAATAHTSV
jgi:hypothetical protein